MYSRSPESGKRPDGAALYNENGASSGSFALSRLRPPAEEDFFRVGILSPKKYCSKNNL
jgi:hypothetical protein